jgi:hypothetical protein
MFLHFKNSYYRLIKKFYKEHLDKAEIEFDILAAPFSPILLCL